GLDFGHNVVIPPQPIPSFAGHFQPNQQRVQRIRVWLGKQGDMALVSHLDLMRLYDRAIRRAALPIAFTGGFHPNPRIIPANALPLGVTSSGEIVDFELTEAIEVATFRDRLAAQLPSNLPIYHAEAVDIQAPAATQSLTQAEYVITIAMESPPDDPAHSQLEPAESDWQQWVNSVLASHAIWVDHTTKSGKSQSINLRDRLSDLKLESTSPNVMLRYIGSCRNDGTLLRPEQVVQMLEQVSGQSLQLLKTHRQRLVLTDGLPVSMMDS
ncbi:MAG TPA: TIGR03936 family radical SAM-associated protein, partial [Microcoleaceae cyanobacterium]